MHFLNARNKTCKGLNEKSPANLKWLEPINKSIGQRLRKLKHVLDGEIVLACEQASLARSDGKEEKEWKPARESENRQCHP